MFLKLKSGLTSAAGVSSKVSIVSPGSSDKIYSMSYSLSADVSYKTSGEGVVVVVVVVVVVLMRTISS